MPAKEDVPVKDIEAGLDCGHVEAEEAVVGLSSIDDPECAIMDVPEQSNTKELGFVLSQSMEERQRQQ